MLKAIKDFIVTLNSKRTIPNDLEYFLDSYWVECFPTIKEPVFIAEIDKLPYKHKYKEYYQTKFGNWKCTNLYLYTDKKGELL